jgi:CheY-like chemotaxis protein
MSIQEIHDHGVLPGIQPPPKRRRASRPSRSRVLIVDDIAENRMVLAMFCEQFGMAHECVEGGREAVEAARSGRFDAILMDIFMPHMDGMIATRAIRDLAQPICSTPIIAVTTAAEPGEVKRYLACGMNDVVAKPIIPSRLLEALSGALAERRKALKVMEQGAESPEEVRLSA